MFSICQGAYGLSREGMESIPGVGVAGGEFDGILRSRAHRSIA